MKKILFIFAIVAIIGLPNFSCSKSNEPKKQAEKKDSISIGITENTTAGEPESKPTSIKNYNTTIININIAGKPINAEQLKDMLPSNIAGTQKSKPSIGTIYGESGDVTTASYTYSFKKGGIVFQIFDYGSLDNIPSYDKKYFNEAPEMSGKETITIVNDNGKGYILWDNDLNSGSMYYFLANRFIIKLEGYTLPPGTGGLAQYFNLLNRNNLINKAKYN